ncbi:alpha/beta fold hydrolase [Streptomyces sp. NPDC091281]|uniref:alpha/beta fold hydrolase n=1 Tax=Streptomyces sp. NPDC091281 TaxID=3365985 RepID=UPI00381A54A7
MTHFVVVAGAWLGAWAWDEVAADLEAAGETVSALTLSGVAERRAEPAGLETHVRDVVGAVEGRDLRDVVLVGHSYSGVPVGIAAGRIGDRLRRVVFVDANVPVAGEGFLDAWPSDPVRAAIAAHDGVWPPPAAEEFAGQGLTDEQIGRITAGATPHPGATLTDPARLARPLGELPATYVKCLLDGDEPPPPVAELVADGRWELVTMDTGHWPMFSRPAELARLLRESAAAR